MNSPVLCTIIAKNYLSSARVLCKSFLEHHPDGICHVLIIDDIEGYLSCETEVFTVHGLETIPSFLSDSICFRYNVIELATAVKPFFIRYLLQNHDCDKLLYLDPDILVTASLKSLYASLDSSPILLTPHIETDFPQDGQQLDETSLFQVGQFNLGFLGVRKCIESETVLLWLENKLSTRCVIDVLKGYFVDQRFFDMAYLLFPWIGIERGTGYNVAHWNLHSRLLTNLDSGYCCNGKPLYFFHFSSYSPKLPHLISKHPIRHNFQSRPDVVSLFADYQKRLVSEGWVETSSWPYGHGTFSDGEKITDETRRIYREHKEWFTRYGDPFAFTWQKLLFLPGNLFLSLRMNFRQIKGLILSRLG